MLTSMDTSNYSLDITGVLDSHILIDYTRWKQHKIDFLYNTDHLLLFLEGTVIDEIGTLCISEFGT